MDEDSSMFFAATLQFPSWRILPATIEDKNPGTVPSMFPTEAMNAGDLGARSIGFGAKQDCASPVDAMASINNRQVVLMSRVDIVIIIRKMKTTGGKRPAATPTFLAAVNGKRDDKAFEALPPTRIEMYNPTYAHTATFPDCWADIPMTNVRYLGR